MAKTGKITFQGEIGAYSDLACRTFQPGLEPVACATFEKAMVAVREGEADLALLPVENSLAGRVSDIHVLLPQSDLHITGEYFMPIHHQLMAQPGVMLDDIKTVRSHVMALGQCRRLFAEYPFKPEASGDTAGAARELAEQPQSDVGVIASAMAAQTYGLTILKKDIEDRGYNTTRFLLMAREPGDVTADDGVIVTSFVFQVRNIPSALYKALGGFATNGVNMTKLESYQLDGSFTATMFYADIEGHPDERSVQLALEELGFFSSSLKILGVYPSARKRGERT